MSFFTTKFSPTNKSYFKRNYVEVLEIVSPDFYIDDDIDLSGTNVNPLDLIVNSHLNIANDITRFFPALSAVTTLAADTTQNVPTSAITTASGMAEYFTKQNDITDITPDYFADYVLRPLGRSFDSFATSSDFADYVSGTMLSSIRLAEHDSMSYNGSAFGNDGSGTYITLLNTLSWFYLLNSSGDGTYNFEYEPSGYVFSAFLDVYRGKTLTLADGIKGLTEFVWRNAGAVPAFAKYIPDIFVSSNKTYTSGLQQLKRMQTLVDVLYSTNLAEQEDSYVRDTFDSYLNSGYTLSSLVPQGPHYKLLKGLSYTLADVNNEIEKLRYLYDIERTPVDILPYLADLIGWELIGSDPDRWRLQLKNAVEIYKALGTKPALQFAVNSVISEGLLDVSSNLYELWESYIPHLIIYALITESSLFKNFKTFTPTIAAQLGIAGYSTSSMEENARIATDSIILDLVRRFKDHFFYGNTPFGSWFGGIKRKDNGLDWTGDYHFHDDFSIWANEFHDDNTIEYELIADGSPFFVFNYRGRSLPIPPFENYKYYKSCNVSPSLIDRLVFKLKCFGVREEFADQVGAYITRYTLGATDLLSFNNNWLFFTSSHEIPDNFTQLIANVGSKNYESIINREDYISLWSGKSSHLHISFAASDFTFTDSLQSHASGGIGLDDTTRVINKFIPAHAIPDIVVWTSATEDYIALDPSAEGDIFVEVPCSANFHGYGASDANVGEFSSTTLGSVLGRQYVSAVDMVSIFGDKFFSRKDVDGPFPCDKGTVNHGDQVFHGLDSAMSSVDAIALPRTTFRRRSFKNFLPRDGYYDRTGFNMPISFDSSVWETSLSGLLDLGNGGLLAFAGSGVGFLPLGFIPSSLSFADVTLSALGVYGSCESLDSSNSYFGYNVSDTFPCRGLSALGANIRFNEDWSSTSADKYIDRGQTPEIIGTMWELMEAIKLKDATKIVETYDNVSATYQTSSSYINVAQSLANSATAASGWYPTSFGDYENFKFGTLVHRLYRDYVNIFKRHGLRGISKDLHGGGNILSHAFGFVNYNGDFLLDGSAVGAYPALINKNTSSVVNISHANGAGLLSFAGAVSGTTMASSVTNLAVPHDGGTSVCSLAFREFVNPHVLSGVELISPSSVSGITKSITDNNRDQNHFMLFRLDNGSYRAGSDNYLLGNTIVKLKSAFGLPRLRFDITKYIGDGYVVNALPREHLFEIETNVVTTEEKASFVGGGTIGLWIHTGLEGGKYIHSYTKDKKWEISDYRNLTISDIYNLSHIISFPVSSLITTVDTDVCIDGILTVSSNDTYNPVSINQLQEKYFQKVKIPFDTRNNTVALSGVYLDSEVNPNLIPATNVKNFNTWTVENGTVDLSAGVVPPVSSCPELSAVWKFTDTGGSIATLTFEDSSFLDVNNREDYTFSVYIKRSEDDATAESDIRFWIGSNVLERAKATIDWSTSTIAEDSISGKGLHEYSFEAVNGNGTDGWFRAAISISNPDGLQAVQVRINSAATNAAETGSILLWGPKIEYGAISDFHSKPTPLWTKPGQLHRDSDQTYFVEAFMIPDKTNKKYTVFDYIKLNDLTDQNRAIIPEEYLFSHKEPNTAPRYNRHCDFSAIYDVPISKDQVYSVFKYFNALSDGELSRNSIITSGKMDTSGGSRINLRDRWDWGNMPGEGGATKSSGLYTRAILVN